MFRTIWIPVKKRNGFRIKGHEVIVEEYFELKIEFEEWVK